MKMEETGSNRQRRQPLMVYDPVEDGWTSPLPNAGRKWARTDGMADMVLRREKMVVLRDIAKDKDTSDAAVDGEEETTIFSVSDRLLRNVLHGNAGVGSHAAATDGNALRLSLDSAAASMKPLLQRTKQHFTKDEELEEESIAGRDDAHIPIRSNVHILRQRRAVDDVAVFPASSPSARRRGNGERSKLRDHRVVQLGQRYWRHLHEQHDASVVRPASHGARMSMENIQQTKPSSSSYEAFKPPRSWPRRVGGGYDIESRRPAIHRRHPRHATTSATAMERHSNTHKHPRAQGELKGESRPERATSRQRTYDALTAVDVTTSYSERELGILRAIVAHAEVFERKRHDLVLLHASDNDEEKEGVDNVDLSVPVVVSFAAVMRSYEVVLGELGIDAAEDIHLYRFLLRLSLVKRHLSWTDALEAEVSRCMRESRARLFKEKKRLADAWLRWKEYSRGPTTPHGHPRQKHGDEKGVAEAKTDQRNGTDASNVAVKSQQNMSTAGSLDPDRDGVNKPETTVSIDDDDVNDKEVLGWSMYVWRRNLHATRREKALDARADGIWRTNTKRRMLRRWRRRRGISFVMTMRAVEMWEANMLGGCIRRWRVGNSRALETSRRADALQHNGRCRRALATWQHRVREERRGRKVLADATNFWTDNRGRVIFYSWRRLRERSRRLHANAKMHLSMTRRRRCLHTWHYSIEQAKVLRHASDVVSRRVAMLQRQAYFYAWHSRYVNKVELAMLMLQAAKRIKRSLLRRGLSAWLSALRHEKKCRRILATMYSRNRKATLKKCSVEWNRWARKQTSMRSRATQVAAANSRRYKATAISVWCEYMARQRAKAIALDTAIRTSMRASRARSFGAWLANVKMLVRLRGIHARFFAYTASALKNESLRAWRDWSCERKRRERIVRRSREEMDRRSKRRSIESWRRWSTRRMRTRSLLSRAIRLSSTRVCRAGLEKWAAVARGRITEREHVETLRRSFMRRRQFYVYEHVWKKKFLQRQKHRQICAMMRTSRLHKAIFGWKSKAVYANACRHKIKVSLEKFQYRQRRRCLMSWIAYAASSAAVKSKLKHALAFMRVSTLARAVNRWTAFSRDRIRAKSLLAKVATRWRLELLLRTINSFVENVQVLKRQRELVQVAMNFFYRRRLTISFLAWIERVNTWMDKRESKRLASSHRNTVLLINGLEGLRRLVFRKAAVADGIRVFAQTYNMRRLCACFLRWREISDANAHKRKNTLRATAQWKDSVMTKCMRMWRSYASRRAHIREVETASLARLVLTRLSKALRGWSSYMDVCRIRREHMHISIARWRRRLQSTAMDCWRSYVLRKLDERSRVRMSLARMMESLLSKSFTTWQANVARLVLDRSSAQIALEIWRVSTERKAFSTWRQVSQVYAIGHHVAMMHAEHTKRRCYDSWSTLKRDVGFERKMLILARGFWTNTVTSTAFALWKENAQRSSQLRRSAAHWRASLLVASITWWAHWAAGVREKRQKHYTALILMRSSRMHTVLLHWRAAVVYHLQRRAHYARIMLAMSYVKLAAVARVWRSEVTRRHMLRRTQLAFADRVTRKRKVAMFSLWLTRSTVQRQHRENIIRAMSLAYYRIRMNALKAWKWCVSRSKAAKHALRRVILMTSRKEMLLSFESWIRVAATTAWSRFFAHRALENWRFRRQLMSLHQWTTYTLRKRDERVATRRAAIHRLLVVGSAALSSWRAFVSTKRAKEEMLTKAIGFWENLTVCKALRGWYISASRKVYLKALLIHAMGRLNFRVMAKAFTSLYVYAVECEQLRFAANFSDTNTVASVFEEWKTQVYHTRGIRSLQADAVRRGMNRLRFIAFSYWLHGALRQRDLRDKFHVVFVRWSTRQRTICVLRWKEWTDEKRRKHARVAQAHYHHRKRLLALTHGFWRTKAVHTAHLQRKLEYASIRWTKFVAYSALNAWLEYTETRVIKKVVLAKAEAYHTHRVLHHLLSIWQSEAEEAKLFRLAFTFCVDTMLRRTFTAWHRLTVQGVAVAHLGARCFSRQMRSLTTRGFAVWRLHVDRRRHKALLANRSAIYFRSAVLLRSFLVWRENVIECLDIRTALAAASGHWDYTRICSVWQSWLLFMDDASAKNALKARALHHWQRTALRTYFSKLRFYSLRYRRAKRVQWMESVSFHRVQVCKEAFTTWSEFAIDAVNESTKTKVAETFLRYTSLSTSLTAWFLITKRNQQLQFKYAYLYRKRSDALMAVAMRGWKLYRSLQEQKMKHIAACTSLYNVRLQRAAWKSWMRYMTVASILVRSLTKMKMRLVAAALLGWVERVELQKRRTQMCRLMITRCQSNLKVAAVNSWIAFVDKCRRHHAAEAFRARRLLATSILVLKFRVDAMLFAESCFSTKMLSAARIAWLAWTHRVHRWRALETKALAMWESYESRRQKLLLALAFTNLLSNRNMMRSMRFMLASRRRRVVAGITTKWLKISRMSTRLLLFASSLQSVVVRGHFNEWRENVLDEMEMKACTSAFLNRLRRCDGLHAGTSDTGEQTVMAVESRCQRAILLLVHFNVAAFFLRWRDNARDIAFDRESEMAADAFHVDSLALTSMAAFAQNVTMQKKLRLAVSYWRDASLRLSLCTWQTFVVAEQRCARLFGKALAFWRHQKLCMALMSWGSFVWRRRRKRTLVKRALETKRILHMRCAFSQWRTWSAQKASSKRFMTKCVAAMTQRRLFTSFCRWQSVALTLASISRSRTQAKLVLDANAKRLHFRMWRARHQHRRRTDAAVRTCERLRYVEIPFARWLDEVSAIKDERRSLQKAVLQCAMHLQRSALTAWMIARNTKVRHRALLARALVSLHQRIEGYVLSFWKAYTTKHKRRREKVLTMLSTSIKNRKMFVLDAWAHYARHQRRRKINVHVCLTRMRDAYRYRAFRGWLETCIHLARGRRVVEDVVRKMQRSVVGAALRAWQSHTDLCIRQRETVRACIARFTRRLAHTSMNAWIDYVDRRMYKRELVSMAVATWRLFHQSSALKMWKEQVRISRRDADFMSVALAHWWSTSTRRCFNQLMAYVDSRRKKRALSRIACDHFKESLLRSYLSSWFFNAKDIRLTRVCIYMFSLSCTSRCLAVWKSFVEDAKLGRAVDFHARQLYAYAWRRWKAFTTATASVNALATARLNTLRAAMSRSCLHAWQRQARISIGVKRQCAERMAVTIRGCVMAWARHVRVTHEMSLRAQVVTDVCVRRWKARLLMLWLAMKRAALYSKRKAVAARFGHWRFLVEDLKATRIKLRHAIEKLSTFMLLRALLSWRNYVRLSCIYRLESIRKQRLQRSAIRKGDDMIRRNKQSLKRAMFTRWRIAHEIFMKLRIAVRHAIRSSTRRAMDMWIAHVESVHIHEEVIAYYQSRRKLACFTAWRDATELTVCRLRRQTGIAQRHHTRRCLRIAMAHWKIFCDVSLFRQNEITALVFAIGAALERNLMHWSWACWRRAVDLRLQKIARHIRAVDHWKKTLVDFAWFSWTCYMRGLQVATTSAYSSDNHSIGSGSTARHSSSTGGGVSGAAASGTKSVSGGGGTYTHDASAMGGSSQRTPPTSGLVRRFMDENATIFEENGDTFSDKVENFFLSPIHLERDMRCVSHVASILGNGTDDDGAAAFGADSPTPSSALRDTPQSRTPQSLLDAHSRSNYTRLLMTMARPNIVL